MEPFLHPKRLLLLFIIIIIIIIITLTPPRLVNLYIWHVYPTHTMSCDKY